MILTLVYLVRTSTITTQILILCACELQQVCLGLRKITRHNKYSMVALHVPISHYQDWAPALDEASIHILPSSISIGSTAPANYAAHIVHCPLRSSDNFIIGRVKEAGRPTHNAFALARCNPKGKWRAIWSDMQVLPASVFNKAKGEVLMRSAEAKMENPLAVEAAQTSFHGSASDTVASAPAFINAAVQKTVKARTKMWRKEQISQGVLDRMLEIFGRAAVCQVLPTFMHTALLYLSFVLYISQPHNIIVSASITLFTHPVVHAPNDCVHNTCSMYKHTQSLCFALCAHCHVRIPIHTQSLHIPV